MTGARIPVAVAHGEGYANFSRQGSTEKVLRAAHFIDHYGTPTERYPFNPNGSPAGLTAVTTVDGRFTVMMPHPERVTRNVMMSWSPRAWGVKDSSGPYTPWMRFFQNARAHIG
jgi:phosphoribosylformylglycinamidine synthase